MTWGTPHWRIAARQDPRELPNDTSEHRPVPASAPPDQALTRQTLSAETHWRGWQADGRRGSAGDVRLRRSTEPSRPDDDIMSATTRWSLIRRAAGDDRDARLALAELCLHWRPAVLHYLRRRRSGAEAEDLTQGFFLHLLEHRLLARGDPTRGRFRDFLYTALRHWLADQQRRQRAHCRGGEAVSIELDTELPGEDEDPAAAFDRCWAACLLQRALAQLAAEAQQQGKQALYDAAAPFLLHSPESTDYLQAAAALGLRPNTFAVAVTRLRRRLQALVRREVGETTDTEDEARAELRRLRGTWQ